MTNRQVPTSPEGKFGKDLEKFVTGLVRAQRFVIPTFAADPPETDPTNVWMRYDGRLRGRVWNGASYTYYDYPMRSDITSPPAVPAYPAAPSPTAPPQSYAKTWPGTWSQTYKGDGTKRTDTSGEVQVVFGTEDPYGNQKSLVGFDYADIVTQLTGSTILSVALVFTALNAYYSSGTTVALGMHNATAEPTTYDVTTTILRYGDQEDVIPGQTVVHNLPVAFAQQLRAGTAKGLVLEAPNADRGFWGAIAGVGGGYTPPQLTITYAK